MNRRTPHKDDCRSEEKTFSFRALGIVPGIQTSQHPRAGSALMMVLGLVVLLSVLITGFGRTLRGDLQAASGFYEEAINMQLARSAYVLATQEMGRANGMPYTDRFGNLYFVSDPRAYASQINTLQELRAGFAVGRGMVSYQFMQKPYALDPNEMSLAEWDRLLEVACEINDESERSALADCLMDWIDTDNNARDEGFEEDDYQSLNPARHCRNAPVENLEEFLMVYGMSEELFYGYGLPVREENGILFGGGIFRYLIGDNSNAAQASVQYIQSGVLPAEDFLDDNDRSSDSYEPLQALPSTIYLVVQGFGLGDEDERSEDWDLEDEINRGSQPFDSRHVMLVTFELPENSESVDQYIVADFQEHAAAGLLEALLAYGVNE